MTDAYTRWCEEEELDANDPYTLSDFLGDEETIRCQCGVHAQDTPYDQSDGTTETFGLTIAVNEHLGKVIVTCPRCGRDVGEDVRWQLKLPRSLPLLVRPEFDATGSSMDLAEAALMVLMSAEQPNHRTFLFNDAPVTVNESGNIKVMSASNLQIALTETARWKLKRGYNDAPFHTATAALRVAAEMDNGLPVLERAVHVPVMHADGTIVTKPGYDEGTRTFYSPAVANIEVKDVVSQADVDDALALIFDELLVDFPFVADADRACALALMLLGFVRGIIDGPTPLHWIGATGSRTGKGKLATSLLTPAFGVVASGSLADQEAERRKNIATKLTKGVGVIKYDNVRGDVRSVSLEMGLTEPRFTDRRLGFNFGSNADIDVAIYVVWVLTANGDAAPAGDVVGRVAPLNLDREVDDPSSFVPANGWHLSQPPEAWALAHRRELVTACLVLCRWWHQKGQPRPTMFPPTLRGIPVLGGYEEWQRVMGGILQAAGVEGFCQNLGDLKAGDEDRSEIRQVFDILKAYGEPKTAAEILKDGKLALLWPGVGTAKTMGLKLRALKDKRSEGFVMRGVHTRSANQWHVIKA